MLAVNLKRDWHATDVRRRPKKYKCINRKRVLLLLLLYTQCYMGNTSDDILYYYTIYLFIPLAVHNNIIINVFIIIFFFFSQSFATGPREKLGQTYKCYIIFRNAPDVHGTKRQISLHTKITILCCRKLRSTNVY